MGKFLLVLVSFFLGRLFIRVDAQTYVYSGCVGAYFNYTDGSVFEKNLDLLLKNLTSKSSVSGFGNSTAGVGSNKVYGLFQCRYDIDLGACNACVKDASRKVIKECPLNGEGVVWYQECMLRYADRNFFALSETFPGAYYWNQGINVSDYKRFEPILANTMKDIIKVASSTSRYNASGTANWTSFEQLYSFAQCTPDIDSFGCDSCLKSALSQMYQCCSKSTWAMVFLASCQLRYGLSPFLKVHSTADKGLSDSQASKKGSSKLVIIVGIAACALVGLIVSAVILWICLRRKKLKKASSEVPPPASPEMMSPASSNGLHDRTGKSDTENFGDKDFVQYDFNALKIATNDFSAENMLGEGGFGIVYKGTFQNGKHLAIKRLSNGSTGQGTTEFMTEARLLAKLQHKNLVRLNGFCSEGDEKLLVYEYMSNGSLDQFLFDPNKRSLLDWITRSKIIIGIARGLQYLHEDSCLTIIHRDLKPGNILLDKEMNPKVADFGLARLFESAQKFGNTNRIVGTQGYMAPEYLLSGEYSEKSDVYSFGIMLLEIVSGQKNRIVNKSPQKEDLSILAWRLWNEGRSFELTDPILLNNCSGNQVIRYIQIGLLCVQANAEQRPTMPAVVLMLTVTVDLPLPSSPMMTSSQYSMPMNYSGPQHSDRDQSSTKSVTMQTDVVDDLYPKPR